MPLKCETYLLQNIAEFTRFLKLIREQKVASYLEIGCKHGGSLWRITNTLPSGSRVVAVDLPHADGSFKQTEVHLKACIEELKRRGYDAHLFLTDSADPATVEAVGKLGPFDLCLIDGNHTEAYIRQDWANYGSLANIVAFHDISHVWLEHKDSKKMPIEAPKVWQEIKQGYEHVEIRAERHYNGLGVLWRTRPVPPT
jgi:Methyltransferase domain